MAKGKTLKKMVICHTNDFKGKINENMKGWIEGNGGKYSKELTPEVTHLIASKQAWKRYHPIVKQARRMRTVRIVKFDWLDMSLNTPPYKALPEDKWSFEQQKLKFPKKSRRKQQNSDEEGDKNAGRRVTIPRDKRIETTGIEFDKACQEFEEDLGTAGFHPYADQTGFVYIITLLRHDIVKNRFEKYRLKLYESDRVPHTYACYAQYTRPAVQKQVHILAPPGSTWPFAWSMFEKFFARKAGVNWDRRIGVGVEINLDGFSKGDEEDFDTDVEREPRTHGQKVQFQYLAPKVGEPDGIRGGFQTPDVGMADQQSIINAASKEGSLESNLGFDKDLSGNKGRTMEAVEKKIGNEHVYAVTNDAIKECSDTPYGAAADTNLS